MSTGETKKNNRPPLWISFLLWVTAVIVMYLLISWYMNERPTETIISEDSVIIEQNHGEATNDMPPAVMPSDTPKTTDQVPRGVPVPAEELLR